MERVKPTGGETAAPGFGIYVPADPAALTPAPPRHRPPAAEHLTTLVTIGLIALIGWIDLATGHEIGFSLFYLVPIVVTGWWRPGRKVIAVAAAAAAAWFVADYSLRTEHYLPISLWNGLTRLVMYLAVGILVSRTRLDRDQMNELNRRLKDLLDAERETARTDRLTGLPNNRFFMELLHRQFAKWRRHPEPFCIAYLDLDNFKGVNDTFGHAAGDDVLRQFAGVLKSELRDEDTPARMGGDEFVVLMTELDETDARDIGTRLVQAVGEIGKNYPGCNLGASVGAICFIQPPATPEEALRIADELLYQSKQSGKSQVVVGNHDA